MDRIKRSAAAPAEAVRLPNIHDVIERFLGRVCELPHVRRVVFETSSDGVRVLTVIEAPPFERRYRDTVFDAESVALAGYEGADLDFGLVNLREYPEDAHEGLIPTAGDVLYQR
jgi:hypothetical protein